MKWSGITLLSGIFNPLCSSLNTLWMIYGTQTPSHTHPHHIIYIINTACTNAVCSKILIIFVVITLDANCCHPSTSHLRSVAFSPHSQPWCKRRPNCETADCTGLNCHGDLRKWCQRLLILTDPCDLVVIFWHFMKEGFCVFSFLFLPYFLCSKVKLAVSMNMVTYSIKAGYVRVSIW